MAMLVDTEILDGFEFYIDIHAHNGRMLMILMMSDISFSTVIRYQIFWYVAWELLAFPSASEQMIGIDQ